MNRRGCDQEEQNLRFIIDARTVLGAQVKAPGKWPSPPAVQAMQPRVSPENSALVPDGLFIKSLCGSTRVYF